MAEEPDVQESNEITLDDFNADEQESPKAAPSPAEDKKPEAEVKETKEEVKADDTAAESEEPEAKETDTEGEENKDQADETETDKPQEEKTLKPKSENRFQKLANENRELKEQVEQLTSQTYQANTVDELTNMVNPETGEAYTVTEAAQAAIDQRDAMRNYNTQIVNVQSYVESDAQHVLSDYAWANPDSGQYDEELAFEAAELVEDKLQRDPNIPEIGPDGQPTGKGLVVGIKGSLSTIYKTLDRASKISATQGQIKGQQATEKMLANADTASNAAPPKAKVDPLMELWKSDD